MAVNSSNSGNMFYRSISRSTKVFPAAKNTGRPACFQVIAVLLLIYLVFAPSRLVGNTTFSIGFSSATVDQVNENDAMAAVRVWSQSLARDQKIPVDPQPYMFRNIGEIEAALKEKTIDCINLTTPEYFSLRHLLSNDKIIAAVTGGAIVEEYAVVVHRESKITDITQLAGKSLAYLQNARTSLAMIWLDTFLAQNGLAGSNLFFSKISTDTKVGKTVLPVFFKQADACLVTRSSFETMVELNPQIGEQLVTIAVSPPFVPVVFCFRNDYNSPVKEQILKEISDWHISPAGRQILTIFQTDSLQEYPITCLNDAVNLLQEHKTIRQKNHPS